MIAIFMVNILYANSLGGSPLCNHGYPLQGRTLTLSQVYRTEWRCDWDLAGSSFCQVRSRGRLRAIWKQNSAASPDSMMHKIIFREGEGTGRARSRPGRSASSVNYCQICTCFMMVLSIIIYENLYWQRLKIPYKFLRLLYWNWF